VADIKITVRAKFKLCLASVLTIITKYMFSFNFVFSHFTSAVASADIATAEMSICLSVCHTLVLYQNEHDFFTDGEPEEFSFLQLLESSQNSKGWV